MYRTKNPLRYGLPSLTFLFSFLPPYSFPFTSTIEIDKQEGKNNGTKYETTVL